MPNAVTIDRYDIKTHIRYATDQEALDTKYIDEASLIPPHFEIPGSHATYSSKLDELFETPLGHHPWAAFAPPPEFFSMRNRFFTYVLSDNFDWADSSEEEDNEEDANQQKREEKQQIEKYKQTIRSKNTKLIPLAVFERDRSALLNLLDSIKQLNGFLRELHARKLQYQKG